jgi:SAM-dependent methyltransferase
MLRIVEPEVMDGAEQSLSYARTDRSNIKQLFKYLYQKTLFNVDIDTMIDIGCGPGDLTVDIAKLHPTTLIDAIDASDEMLKCCEPQANVTFKKTFLHSVTSKYDRVVSSLTLHHFHNPNDFWNAINSIGTKDVFVFDFIRPSSEDELQLIVDSNGPYKYDIVKTDLENSLRASFTVDELRYQLVNAGLNLNIEEIVVGNGPMCVATISGELNVE